MHMLDVNVVGAHVAVVNQASSGTAHIPFLSLLLVVLNLRSCMPRTHPLVIRPKYARL